MQDDTNQVPLRFIRFHTPTKLNKTKQNLSHCSYAMICPNPYTVAGTSLWEALFKLQVLCKTSFQAYLVFFTYLFLILGGHMESLCGKLQH